MLYVHQPFKRIHSSFKMKAISVAPTIPIGLKFLSATDSPVTISLPKQKGNEPLTKEENNSLITHTHTQNNKKLNTTHAHLYFIGLPVPLSRRSSPNSVVALAGLPWCASGSRRSAERWDEARDEAGDMWPWVKTQIVPSEHLVPLLK